MMKPGTLDSRRNLVSFLILILLPAAAYARALFGPFQFDDKKALLLRRDFHDISDIGRVLGFDRLLPRPIFDFSLALDWRIWGARPFGFHLTNLVLHLAVCLLLLSVFYRLLEGSSGTSERRDVGFELAPRNNLWWAWLGALIFSIHPIVTETVAYIWSRSSLLSALFWLLSLDLYLIYRRGDGERGRLKPALTYFCSITSFVAALASKEIAATLPGMLLLGELWIKPGNGSRKGYWALVPYFGLAGIEIALRLLYTGRIAFGGGENYLGHLAIQGRVAASCIGLFLWPARLNIDHYVPSAYPVWEVATSFVLLVGLAASAVIFRRKRSLAAFCVGWFFVALSPFFLIPLKDKMVERNMYFPAMGLSFLLALGLRRLRHKSSKLLILMTFSLVALFFVRTVGRNTDWTSEWRLWADAHKNSPEKARPYNYLGALAIEDGELEKAQLLLEAGGRRAPQYAEIHHNLGVIALRKGDYERASYEFAVARANEPAMVDAYVNQGRAEIMLNREEKAEKLLRTAIKRQSDRVDARVLLADLLRNRGDIENAMKYLDEALAIEPRSYEVALDMALVADQESNREESLKWLARAIAIDSKRPKARHALGRLYGKSGEWPSAVVELKKALDSDNKNPEIYADLGIAYMRLHRWDDARKAFASEMKLRPASPLPVMRLAALEETAGNQKEALDLYKRALRMDKQEKYKAELEKVIERLESDAQ